MVDDFLIRPLTEYEAETLGAEVPGLVALWHGVWAGYIYPHFEVGQAWLRGRVERPYRRRGVGTQLVQAIEAQIRETRSDIQRLLALVNEPREDMIALWTSCRYTHVRDGLQMTTLLHTFSQPTPMPPGFVLRPFDPATDARAVYEADQESFRENWGYAGDSFERWMHDYVETELFDESLWTVAYDGAEVAGFCEARAKAKNYPMAGWIETLAVRPAWRRRGLGEALLRQELYLLQRLGYMTASLGVDAGNETGAVALYERIGMRVETRQRVYQKLLG